MKIYDLLPTPVANGAKKWKWKWNGVFTCLFLESNYQRLWINLRGNGKGANHYRFKIMIKSNSFRNIDIFGSKW